MATAQGTQALKAVATGQADAQSLANMKPKDQIAHLLQRKQGEIAKMLPRHLNPDRLLKVAQIAATTTPALLECEVPSLVAAIGQCAQMGLEPNTVLGHAYLVPFNVKRKRGNAEEWVKSVQVIIGYKGLIDLARRSGQIVSISAHEVCKNDAFELIYGLDEKLNHTPAFGDRGDIIGFYAVAKLKDGGNAFEFMSKHQIEEIMANTQSKGKYGPWKDHFTEMGRKTVIRRLAKYLPLSIEFQTAVVLDQKADQGIDQNLESIDGEFMLAGDAPMLEAPEPPQQEQATGQPEPLSFAQVADKLEKADAIDVLEVAADLIPAVADEQQRKELTAIYKRRADELAA
jgi:recombination protein RecT